MTKLGVTLVLVLVVLCGCNDVKYAIKSTPTDVQSVLFFCDPAIDRGVLDYIYRSVPNYNWVDADNTNAKQLDEEQAKIDQIRAWSKTQERCVRLAYEGWLDFYQYDLDEAKAKHGKREHETQFLQDYPVPEPPQVR